MVKVPVYLSEQDKRTPVARVMYNTDLDYWTGNDWQNGGVGCHKGITKLRDGRYVIIYGSQWDGDKDYGIIVSPQEALAEITNARRTELLKTYKYKELRNEVEDSNKARRAELLK